MRPRIPPQGFEGPDEAAVDALQHILGNTSRLIGTTLAFRWNVMGPTFPLLQTVFGDQIDEMRAGQDAVASRIRALGMPVIADYSDEIVLPLSQAGADRAETLPATEQMLAILAEAHRAMGSSLGAAHDVCRDSGEEACAALVIERRGAHDAHCSALSALREPAR